MARSVPVAVATLLVAALFVPSVTSCKPGGETDATLQAVQARLDFDATVLPSPQPADQPNAYTLAWLSLLSASTIS